MKSYLAFGVLCGVLTFLLIKVISGKKMSDDDGGFAIDSSHLPIEHSFGLEDKFSPRGNIVFHTSKAGYASFKSTPELSNDDIDKLQKLVSENGLYYIRSPTKIGSTFEAEDANNQTATKYVQTFVKACYLYGSRLQETITVSVDNSGNIIGLNIVSPRSQCSTDDHYSNVPTIFNSSVVVQQQVAGAVPDTATYNKNIEREARSESGKSKDNRSFLAKYWMYILPVFLILMLSSQAEQPGEGGGE